MSKNPLREVLRDDWRNVLRAFCLRIAETAGYAVSVTFLLSYLVNEKLADRPVTPHRAADRRRRSASAPPSAGARSPTASAAGRCTCSAPRSRCCGASRCSCWSTPGRPPLIVLAFVVSYAVCQNSLAGVQGAWFSELFAAKTRTTGASLAYQLSAVVSGFTPLVATALFAGFGWIGPALLLSGYGLLGLLAAFADPRRPGASSSATTSPRSSAPRSAARTSLRRPDR